MSLLNLNFPTFPDERKQKVLLPEILRRNSSLKSTEHTEWDQNQSKFPENLTTRLETRQMKRDQCDTPCFNKRRSPDLHLQSKNESSESQDSEAFTQTNSKLIQLPATSKI